MLTKIKTILNDLSCCHSSEELEKALDTAQQNDLTYLEFLDELFNYELTYRKTNKTQKLLKSAGFPKIKTIDEFDFRFQTSITKRDVNEWLDFTWIEQRKNKILMGPPGVGKTHLVLATGYSAINKGYQVLFRTMQGLMEEMIFAEAEKKFANYMKKMKKYDLIIIDELGYMPLKPIYANLFFQLVNQCYEYRSIMITSNKLYSEWGSFFGDQTIATAILDRLLHYTESIVLNGDSYRLKDIQGK